MEDENETTSESSEAECKDEKGECQDGWQDKDKLECEEEWVVFQEESESDISEMEMEREEEKESESDISEKEMEGEEAKESESDISEKEMEGEEEKESESDISEKEMEREEERNSKKKVKASEPYFICLRLDTALENIGLEKAACFHNCGCN